MNTKLFFPSFFALLIAVNSFAAYFVFNKDRRDAPVTREEFATAFEIINSYAYPQILIQQTRLKEVYPQKANASAQEEHFIREKVQNVAAHLDIMFVPDTIYEMAIIVTPINPNTIASVEKTIFPRKAVAGLNNDLMFEGVDYRCNDRVSCLDAQLDKFASYNNDPLIQDLAFTINENLVDILKQNKILPHEALSEDDSSSARLTNYLFKAMQKGMSRTVQDVEQEYAWLIDKNKTNFNRLVVRAWAEDARNKIATLRKGQVTHLESVVRLILINEFITVLRRLRSSFADDNAVERDLIQTISERIEIFEGFKKTLTAEGLVLTNEQSFDKAHAKQLLGRLQSVRHDDAELLAAMFVAFADWEDVVEISPIKDFKEYRTRRNNINARFPDWSKQVLVHVAKRQIRAHKNNEHLLFRGSSGLKVRNGQHLEEAIGTPDSPFYVDKDVFRAVSREEILRDAAPRIHDLADYSISLGNSLLAGIYFDPGACGWAYLATSRYGYSLSVAKKDARTLKHIFIAPTHPLVAFFGKGEFFHSRSKVARSALHAVGVSPTGGGVPEIIVVDGKDTALDIGIALRSYYLSHMTLMTYKEVGVPPQLLSTDKSLAEKLEQAFHQQVEREFDVYLLGKHQAKQKLLNEEIRQPRK